MYATGLRCVFCNAEYPLEILYGCRACGGTLEVVYDYARAFTEEPFAAHPKRKDLWRYRALLPLRPETKPVTLGEGGTPLTRAGRLVEYVGHELLYLKNETVNPTLSFKDRPLTVGVTAARQFGVGAVVAASTGNTAAATAAYAARAKLPCRLYVPRETPPEKLTLMRAYGAGVVEVDGDFSAAHARAVQVAEAEGAFNLTSTFLNPYALEGDKTPAYEIFEQLGDAPDWLVIPVGAGPLLVGCFKGFRELQLAGKISRPPRLVAVQARGCAPLVRAFEAGKEEVESWKEPPRTIAGGIADPLTGYPRDGTRTLRTVRASNGLAVAVGDEETLESLKATAACEGLFVEPAAATAVAAARFLVRAGKVAPRESLVCVLTGHGLKDVAAYEEERT